MPAAREKAAPPAARPQGYGYLIGKILCVTPMFMFVTKYVTPELVMLATPIHVAPPIQVVVKFVVHVM